MRHFRSVFVGPRRLPKRVLGVFLGSGLSLGVLLGGGTPADASPLADLKVSVARVQLHETEPGTYKLVVLPLSKPGPVAGKDGGSKNGAGVVKVFQADRTANQPRRLVVDYYGLSGRGGKNLPLKDKRLKGIRIGDHGDRTRIVIDLKSDSPLAVTGPERLGTGDAYRIAFTFVPENLRKPKASPTPKTPAGKGVAGEKAAAAEEAGKQTSAELFDARKERATAIPSKLPSLSPSVAPTATPAVRPFSSPVPAAQSSSGEHRIAGGEPVDEPDELATRAPSLSPPVSPQTPGLGSPAPSLSPPSSLSESVTPRPTSRPEIEEAERTASQALPSPSFLRETARSTPTVGTAPIGGAPSEQVTPEPELDIDPDELTSTIDPLKPDAPTPDPRKPDPRKPSDGKLPVSSPSSGSSDILNPNSATAAPERISQEASREAPGEIPAGSMIVAPDDPLSEPSASEIIRAPKVPVVKESEGEPVLSDIGFEKLKDSGASAVWLLVSPLQKYTLEKRRDDLFELTLENGKIGQPGLTLPRFSPEGIDGFELAVAKQEGPNVVVRIFVEEGIRLFPFVAHGKLWVKAMR